MSTCRVFSCVVGRGCLYDQCIFLARLLVFALHHSIFQEAEVKRFYEDLQLLELTPKKDVLFFIGDWNAKAGSQETPGVTGKIGLGMQMKQGKD